MWDNWTFGMKFVGVLGTAVGTIWSAIVGALGWSIIGLVGLMGADFATGMLAASIKGGTGLQSSVGREGFKKKLGVLILLGAVFLMEKIVFKTEHLGDGVAIAYMIVEFISITENLGKMGVPLGPVNNIIAVLKPKGEGKK
ncbi:phage holin family protein [Peribacillus alkalitolerans]|uniref:phage holin family protein n=1 Tax=Peribacillus alkalitolerans TaxID=1550385 RepID=UPI0013D87E9A|nr:phage holin family protein [Peribacillus alkalitolerans]